MSEQSMGETDANSKETALVDDSRIAGVRWQAPVRAFGVRAAALAGLAAAVGTVGVGALNGVFDSPDALATYSWPMGSTCCIEDNAAL